MKFAGFVGCSVLAFAFASILSSCGDTSDSRILDDSADYGRALKIFKNPATGKLSFDAFYTLASDPDGMNLLLTFKTDISDSELAGLPAEMYWNLIGSNGLVAVPATSTNSKIPKSSLKVGQINIKNSYSVSRAILSLKNGKLLFGTSAKEALSNPMFNLDVGAICVSASDLFTNLTNNKKCTEIVESDVGGI